MENKGELEESRARRITVDERLSEELVRLLVCQLIPGREGFSGDPADWSDEKEVYVNPDNYLEVLRVPEDQAPAFETLQEGQVFISGVFEPVDDRAGTMGFRVDSQQRAFSRIDQLAGFRDYVRRLYSDVVSRRE